MNTTTSVPITNGHGNGHAYGTVSPPPTESNPASGSDISSEDGHHDPGSSSGYYGNGFAEAQYRPTHNEEIVNHLYHSGFQTGNYADTILHVHQNVYRLHAIILARSPFLAHLMSTSPQGGGPRTIFVPLEHEPEVTQEGFAIALGYLYSSVSISVMRPENARAVLAAGCLLGGMDDLCQTAYEVCRQSISVETIGSWLEFLDTLPSPRPVHSGTSTGTSTPVLSVPQLNTVFGPYAQRIRDDVFHFLIVALPQILEVNHAPSEDGTGQDGRRVLIDIFSRVPFEMFKTAIESPSFLIGSEQARFKFAKDAIEIRKRGIARAGGDEHVVLAFGGGNAGSAVHVTRKLRKRPLWKVNA